MEVSAIIEKLIYMTQYFSFTKKANMPFPVEEQYIRATESDLGVTFPRSFKERMMISNGGELLAEEYEMELFPFFDQSDKRRVSRTCNHIGLETNNAREWDGFPKNAIAIGADGLGNLLLLIHSGDGELGEELFFWNHENGCAEKIADSIDAIE